MNVRLLKRIKREILKEPGRFEMACWVRTQFEKSPCGTAACIGGWAVILSKVKGRMTKERFQESARRAAWGDTSEFHSAHGLLELSREQAARLFNWSMWPGEFRSSIDEGTPAFAEAAAARIDHFIKTKGAE